MLTFRFPQARSPSLSRILSLTLRSLQHLSPRKPSPSPRNHNPSTPRRNSIPPTAKQATHRPHIPISSPTLLHMRSTPRAPHLLRNSTSSNPLPQSSPAPSRPTAQARRSMIS